MITIIAKIISYTLNPVILSVPMVFFLVYYQTYDQALALKWMFITSFYVAIIGAFLIIEVREKEFSDLDVSKQSQRPRLFIFLFIISILYLGTLFILNAPFILKVSTGGIIFYLVLLSLINTKIKASIHVAYITACCTGLFLLYGGISVLWFMTIPLVAWSRLYLKRHTRREVVTGFLLGIFIPVLIYYLSRSF